MSQNPGEPDFDSPSHSSLAARVRGALAGRYTVQRRIGSGGMATVYLAEDPRHQRQVAIKVLRAELASALGAERFLREIRIAAQLQHPHILPLLDSGEADGLLYYVMPFVQGESLRERLKREGQLPIAEAARILRDVTDALAYAHAQNVVHRDVKPDNIMLSGRHALLMDFGVAKAVSQAARPSGQSSLTMRGISVGTPAYMAPEQALADPNLDHRVDIYAVGIVAYELLTGAFPFEATTPEAVLSAHLTEPPRPVTERRLGISPELAHLVMRCLAKSRADRWQSAEELVRQFEVLTTPSGGTQSVGGVRWPRSRELLGALALALLAVVAWIGLRGRGRGAAQAASYHQLTFSGTVLDAAISPDGRYVAYINGKSEGPGRLWVQETSGGKPFERASFDSVMSIDWTSVMSIDWTADARDILVRGSLDSAGAGTWAVPVIGDEPRVLSGYYIAALSPDRRRVAECCIRKSENGTRGFAFQLRDLGTGSLETLAVRLRSAGPIPTVWSPRGQVLAFLSGEGMDSANVEMIPAGGGEQKDLFEDSISPLAFWWGGTGENLYYTRRSGLDLQLWKTRVSPQTGAARGHPTLLVPSLERGISSRYSLHEGFSISADRRRLVFVHVVPRTNLHSLAVPPSLTARQARELTTGTSFIGGAQLSPDGGLVVFSAGGPSGIDMFTMSMAGGTARQLTSLSLRDGANVAWSPDGRIVAFCADDGTGWHVWVVHTPVGIPHKLPRTRAAPWCEVAWVTAQRLIYIAKGNRTTAGWGPARVLDLTSELDWPVVDNDTSSRMTSPRVSPDGKWVAVEWDIRRDGKNGVWLLSLADSSQRFLIADATPMRWAPRGDAIYAYREQNVLHVPAGGGAESVVARLPVDWDCRALDIAPDSRRLICAKDETQRDAWMIENFDPDVPAAKP